MGELPLPVTEKGTRPAGAESDPRWAGAGRPWVLSFLPTTNAKKSTANGS